MMRKTLILALLITIAATFGLLMAFPTDHADAAQSSTPDTITVLGYGAAKAPADRAHVRLTTGGSSSFYGPEGPVFEPVDEETLAIMRDVLIANGILSTTITTDAFATSSFDPSATVGEVRFVSSEPAALNDFIMTVVEQLEADRGPKIRGATAIFAVNDCAALEADAMQTAFANARARAESVAAEMGLSLGDLLTVSEHTNPVSFYGASASGGCATIASIIDQAGIGTVGLSKNAADGVTISFTVQATFAAN